ncbi:MULTISPECIES: hypothetical protein [unclassified Carboxylicivirga]|uniref:hypothetical protein n=1 Tax=Carboxylicivirga TaxID=1628153 RepID=UPI003D3505AF
MTEIEKRGSFLPEAYQVPDKTRQFMKLTPGDNVIRVLSAPMLGYVVFTEDKKPHRRHIEEGDFTTDALREVRAKRNEDGDFEGSKHFWIMLVWDYASKAPKILEITQISVLKPLYALAEDEDWGDLRDFDINIHRTGTGKNDTEFAVTPKPHKPLQADIEDVIQQLEEKQLLDLNAIWRGEYPFEIYNW